MEYWLKKNIWLIKNIALYFLVLGSLLYISSVTIDKTTNVFKERSQIEGKDLIFKLYMSYNKDLRLLCLITNCNYFVIVDKVKSKDYIYHAEMNKAYEKDHDPSLSDYNLLRKKLVLHYDDYTFIIDRDNPIIQNPANQLKIRFSIFFILLYTTLHLAISIIYRRNRIREKAFLKTKLETTIQYELTESLHHELQGPISIIEALVKNVYTRWYPCNRTYDGVCDFRNENFPLKKCKGCPTREVIEDLQKEEDNPIRDFYSIHLNIDRIKSTLKLLANNKKIKYKNGSSSLLEIIENTLTTKKLLQVNKFSSVIIDKESLSEISAGRGLNNALIMNVVNNLITNSIEAGATQLTIKPQLDTQKNRCYLSIIDNGHGILDGKGNIIPTNQIFKYGFSTKDKENNPFLVNFIKRILETVLGSATVNLSSRGAGLSISKHIMVNGGGDILLHQTSREGTEFILVIPYKKKQNPTHKGK